MEKLEAGGGARPEGRRIRRRLAWVLAGLGVLIASSALAGGRFLWFTAPGYAPARAAAPGAPVMSMEEYGEVSGAHARPYVVRFAHGASGGRLLVFGVSEHTSDPSATDLTAISAAWEELRPTVALTESRLGVWLGGRGAVVRQFGESGHLAWLARRAGVRVHTLELPLAEEIAGVLAHRTPEHTAMYFVLRPYFGARRAGPIADPEGFIAESVRKRTRIGGLRGEISGAADIDRVWARDFAGLPDWRECDDRYGWPGALNDVGATANAVRNAHWLDVMVELVSGGERVIAVVGCSHAVRLEPALASVLEVER